MGEIRNIKRRIEDLLYILKTNPIIEERQEIYIEIKTLRKKLNNYENL